MGKHRSPWTNARHPKDGKDDDDAKNGNDDENEELRHLELTFNEVWNSYKGLYYGHESVGSVFLKESKDGGGSFEGLFGILKKTSNGAWNSASIVHVGEPGEKECTYRVETSLWVVLEPSIDGDDEACCSTSTDVSLTVSKEVTKTCKLFPDKIPLHVSHIENLGTLIEANEIDLRSSLEKVLIPKNHEIFDTVQQKKRETTRPQINPLMGMVMNSDLLKKKLSMREAKDSTVETEREVAQGAPNGVAAAIKKKPPMGRPPGGVNPLAGMVVNPEMLKKKLSKTKLTDS